MNISGSRTEKEKKQPEKQDHQIPTPSKIDLAKKYWAFVRPYRFILLGIILLGILQLTAPLTVPWMTKILVDDVLLQNGLTGTAIKTGEDTGQGTTDWTLKHVALIMAAAFIFSVSVQFIRDLVTAHLGTKMVVDIRSQLYKHLQKLSPKFYDNRPVGGVVSRVLHDVNGAQNLVGHGVINVVVDLFVVIFASYFLFMIDWRLALLALWILPMYYLSFTNLNVRIRFAWRSVHRQVERISSVLVERISGIKIVQSFNQEAREHERFHKQSTFFYDYVMHAHVLSNILGRITQSFNHLGVVMIWFVGGTFVMQGEITIGALIAFQAYLGQMYGPIQRFSEVNITVQNSMANVERIFEVFEYKVDIENKEMAKVIENIKGDVRFENVSFTYVAERPDAPKVSYKNGDIDLIERYKPDKKFYLIPPRTRPGLPPLVVEKFKALRNISFHAMPGQVIALVGASGAGKSTLIHLIPRFYDPDEGSIYLDGMDLRNHDLFHLRSSIAMVMQDNLLFSGTAAENIAYGHPEATMDEIVKAAKTANAHQFISDWEKGYDTLLGERGVRLSGGQKQRIAIARALLNDPKILILDEATSSLDAESEALVTEALENLLVHRTTFIIAHRLATVVRADLILVMDRGEVVETGTHEVLLQDNGIYRKLYEMQLKAMRPEELEKAKKLLGS
jgi:ABC-type multidrug transport system fused ATPase/permease subunit